MSYRQLPDAEVVRTDGNNKQILQKGKTEHRYIVTYPQIKTHLTTP